MGIRLLHSSYERPPCSEKDLKGTVVNRSCHFIDWNYVYSPFNAKNLVFVMMFVQQIKMHNATLFRKHLHHWLQCNEFRILKHILRIHIPQHKLTYDSRKQKLRVVPKNLRFLVFPHQNWQHLINEIVIKVMLMVVLLFIFFNFN